MQADSALNEHHNAIFIDFGADGVNNPLISELATMSQLLNYDETITSGVIAAGSRQGLSTLSAKVGNFADVAERIDPDLAAAMGGIHYFLEGMSLKDALEMAEQTEA